MSNTSVEKVVSRLNEGFSSTLWWGNLKDSATIHRIGDRAFITWNEDGVNHATSSINNLGNGKSEIEEEIISLVNQGYELVLGSK